MERKLYVPHRSAFGTLPSGRLSCGPRGCPSRTLYGDDIIPQRLAKCNSFAKKNGYTFAKKTATKKVY